MENQILFRAKSVEKNEWVTGFYVEEHNIPINKDDGNGESVECGTCSSYSIFNPENEKIWTEIKKETVGQLFSGMPASNSEQLFQKDIIEANGSKYYMDDFFDWHVSYSMIQEEIKLIGNSIDNPELLADIN